MPNFTDTRRLNFTARQIYDLVIDVEKYHEFVPYCSKCNITGREKNLIYADMEVSFGFYQKSYSSRIEHGILESDSDVIPPTISGWIRGPEKEILSWQGQEVMDLATSKPGITCEGYFISITQVSGPFTKLNTDWTFVKDKKNGCIVTFDIEFEFESGITNLLIGSLFDEATKIMINAFEERARSIYVDYKD